MNTAAAEQINAFLLRMKSERNCSAHTLSNYRRDLQTLLAYCQQQELHDWDQVEEQHIRALVALRHRRGMAGSSLQRMLSAWRSFFKVLVRQNLIKNNPATHVQAPRSGRPLPHTLDIPQINQLLELEGNDIESVRDRAILELFYSTGLRLSELTGLSVEDGKKALSGELVVRGKGNRERQVIIGSQAKAALQDWLQRRVELANVDETALFVGKRGRKLHNSVWQKRIKLLAQRQGIDSNVYTHLLRHSFASHMLEQSGDLRAVQELLGHADIATTQIYTHLDFQHLAKVYDEAHPRARRQMEKSEKVD